ncbi:MAG: ECF transporter S component [Clostridiales Family XIII bacterium]|jgi:energy-coupling factor transport system substrate-specific component|nr:ECF transporter S component [Clostridiales Family XIII bacterium]
MLKRFSAYDLIVIAVMAAVGVAIKPVVASVAHVISAPLMIPGGSLAGGLYMMWIVLAFALTGKYGSATLAGLVQAIIVMLTGVPGSHGLMSLFSYVSPGLVVDLLMLALTLPRKRSFDRLASFFAGIAANVMGTLAVNVIFFRLPPLFLALTLSVSAVSGGVGGLIAWELFRVMRKYGLVKR